MRTLLSLAKSLGVERFCVEQVEDRMKRMGMFSLTFGIDIGFALAAAFAAEPSEAELVKQAKITKAEAERVALARVSQGVVKRAEIENEIGHLLLSFDIAKPGTNDIIEIL